MFFIDVYGAIHNILKFIFIPWFDYDKKMYEIFGPKWYNLAFSVVKKKLKEKEIFDKLPKETKLFLVMKSMPVLNKEQSVLFV